jgi:hypothetical protein
MAKQSGLGDNFYIDGFDFSGDVAALDSVRGGPAPYPVTGINKSAMERIGGERTGELAFTSWFNPAAFGAGIHGVLRSLPLTDRIATYARGTVLGNEGACIVGKQINWDYARGNNGSLKAKCQILSNGYGLSWGRQLTAGIRADTAATNGTGVDFTAASSFGLVAFLQVFAFTGTSATVKLQESQNDGAGDAYADVTGGAFSTVTGAGAQRIATAGNLAVERWLRVVTTGTFSVCNFSVVVARHLTATVY